MFRDGKLSRYGWMVIESFLIFIAAIVAFVLVERYMPAKEGTSHAALYTTIVGLLGVYFRTMWNGRQAEKNEEILHGQNRDLTEIKTNVNGQTAAMVESVKTSYQQHIDSMREHFRVERHDLLGQINRKELMLAQAQQQLAVNAAKLKDDEARIKTLEELLRNCTKSKESSDGSGTNAGQI